MNPFIAPLDLTRSPLQMNKACGHTAERSMVEIFEVSCNTEFGLKILSVRMFPF